MTAEPIRLMQPSRPDMEDLGAPAFPCADHARMSQDVASIKATIGEQPDALAGKAGSGIAKAVHEMYMVHLAEQSRGTNLMSKVKNITALLALIAAAATVLTGSGAAILWLFRWMHHLV